MGKSQNLGYGDGELTRETKTATSKVHMSLEAKGNRPIVGDTPQTTYPHDAPNRPSSVSIKSKKRF